MWLSITITKNNNYYTFGQKVKQNENILKYTNGENVICVTAFDRKKECFSYVEKQNYLHKALDMYMFAYPQF